MQDREQREAGEALRILRSADRSLGEGLAELERARLRIGRTMKRLEASEEPDEDEEDEEEPAPRTPPVTGHPRPTKPPTPVGDPIPQLSYRIEMRSGSTFSTRAPVELPFPIGEVRIGPFHVGVTWDRFDPKMGWKPTLFPRNAFAGSGVVHWVKAEFTVRDGHGGGWDFNLSYKDPATGEILHNGVMFPRWCLPQTSINLTDFERYYSYETMSRVPEWIRDQCLAEAGAAFGGKVGPYPIWFKGGSFGNPDAPHAIAAAPYHGGSEDWMLTFWEGAYRRFREFLGAACFGFWASNDDGSWFNPAAKGEFYWWSQSWLEGAPPEWQWTPDYSGWCHYELELAEIVCPNIEHYGPVYKAALAMARAGLNAGKYVAKALHEEIKRSYSLDPNAPYTKPKSDGTWDDILLSPLTQLLEITEPGAQFGVPNWNKWGNRREGQAAALVAMYAEHMTPEERETELPAWLQFLGQLTDDRGVCNKDSSGDAAGSSVPPPTGMAFHSQLAGKGLGFVERAAHWYLSSEAIKRCRPYLGAFLRIFNWWGVKPPYYAHVGGDFESALDAPHKDEAVVDYSLFTHYGTFAGYGSFAGVVAASTGRHFDESPLDCVPPEDRDWSSVT